MWLRIAPVVTRWIRDLVHRQVGLFLSMSPEFPEWRIRVFPQEGPVDLCTSSSSALWDAEPEGHDQTKEHGGVGGLCFVSRNKQYGVDRLSFLFRVRLGKLNEVSWCAVAMSAT